MWISKRQARDIFRAARWNEQEMYGRAEVYRTEHGIYPDEYLKVQRETVRAWERYIACPMISGMWVEG